MDGEEFMEFGTQLREGDAHYMESGGKGRPIHRDLSTAQEREFYGKVGTFEIKNSRTSKVNKFLREFHYSSLIPWS